MFENEYTWGKALASGTEEQFHEQFDMAIKQARSTLGNNHPLIINGKEKFTEDKFEVRCPSDTRIILGTFSQASKNDTIDAINSAKSAFSTWSQLDFNVRAKIFQDCANEFSKKKFYLAALMSFENGKNRFESMGDVEETIECLRV